MRRRRSVRELSDSLPILRRVVWYDLRQGRRRIVSPCTVATRIVNTVRTLGRELIPKWSSRLANGKSSSSTARLCKIPGFRKYHVGDQGKSRFQISRIFFKKTIDNFVFKFYYFSQGDLWKDRLMSVVLVVQNGSVFSTSQRFAQIRRIRSHCGPLSPW